MSTAAGRKKRPTLNAATMTKGHIIHELPRYCCRFLGSVHRSMQRLCAHHDRAHSTLLRDVHDLPLRRANQHRNSVMAWRDSHHHVESLNLQPTLIVDHME